MAELTGEQHDQGLEFAKQLAHFVRENAPDDYCESKGHKLVFEIQQRYGYSSRLKRTGILQHLRKHGGTSSVPEIIEHFGWHRNETYEIVRDLAKDGTVEYYSAEGAGPGPGRKAQRIRLVAQSA